MQNPQLDNDDGEISAAPTASLVAINVQTDAELWKARAKMKKGGAPTSGLDLYADSHINILAKDVLKIIGLANLSGDYASVIQQAKTFEGFSRPSCMLNRDLAKIHITAIEALLKLGRTDEAEDRIKWLRSTYGAEPTIAYTTAKFYELRGDIPGAILTINEALAAVFSKGKGLNTDKLVLLKAHLLISLGQNSRARELLADKMASLQSFEYFKLLRRCITREDEVAYYENLVLPRLSKMGANARHALYHYSYLLREFGNFERAIQIARDRFLTIINLHEFGSFPKKKGAAWTKEAEVALADLQADFHAAGIDFFLISGTLLGCVRENGIIGHDKDIDVGVIEDISLERVYEGMKKSKRFFIRPIDSVHSVYIEHANGVKIDVFRHFMQDGKLYHEGPKVAWWNTPFNLVKTEFLGRTYFIPDNADIYLRENYGDWRTPDSEFETFVDTPNMEVRNKNYLLWYYFLSLGDYFVRGKIGQFKRVWDAIAKLYPVDPLLRGAVEDIVANTQNYHRAAACPPDLTRPMSETAQLVHAPSNLGLDALADGVRPRPPSRLGALLRSRLGIGSSMSSAQAYADARRAKQEYNSSPNDPASRKDFEASAKRAGRLLQASQDYLEACKVWYELRQFDEVRNVADRNLSICALKGARSSEAVGSRSTALTFWRYLQVVEPNSDTAVKGIRRCT